MNLKNSLKWLIRGWLPEEPRMRKNLIKERARLPIAIAISVTFVIVSFYLLSPSATTQPKSIPPPPPTVTGEYNLGVSVGDYVIYGNFVCKFDHRARGEEVVCINDLAFSKVEVIAVSGSEVTFLYTQQYKNGSATCITGYTQKLDVEAAWWSDGTEYYLDYSLIIAANLTEGNCIHARGSGDICDVPSHQVTRIEERTYLGLSRNVIPLRYSHSESGDNYHITFNEVTVYDQESGIKLEKLVTANGDVKSGITLNKSITSDGDVVWAMSIIETNIF